ncbi:MAG: hypothetical protein QM731_10495 [Chitinophagaceae bacterium]
MARQVGPVKWERTIGDLTLYKLGDKWYARAKSSLSSKRVKTKPEFAKTREYAYRMGIAARLASMIYSQLHESWQLHEVYKKLTGLAMKKLNLGRDPNYILDDLEELMYELGYRNNIPYQTVQPLSVAIKIPPAQAETTTATNTATTSRTTIRRKTKKLTLDELINAAIEYTPRKYHHKPEQYPPPPG